MVDRFIFMSTNIVVKIIKGLKLENKAGTASFFSSDTIPTTVMPYFQILRLRDMHFCANADVVLP